MGSTQRSYRPVTRIDLAASTLALLAPRALTPAIDQVRRDLHGLLDGALGRAERSYGTEQLSFRSPRPLHDIDPLEYALPKSLSNSYAGLKRDLRVLIGSIQGQHPPPVIARKPKPLVCDAPALSATSAKNAQPSATRRVRIVRVTRETADAVTLTLEDARGAKLAFDAGQFLSVRAEVAGETLWRAYSICTAPGSGELAITIKRVVGGRVSNHLNEHARVGQELEVRGPSGRFTLAAASAPRHVVLLGGGSGITPLISHARHLIDSEPHTQVTLLYGNRRLEDIVFRQELEQLAVRHAERFRLRHVLSEPCADIVCASGMLDQLTTQRELDALGVCDSEHTLYMICGPAPMMTAAHAALSARDVPDERIHEERFSGPGEGVLPDRSGYAEQLVHMRVKGKSSELRVKAGQTLLDAALAAEVPLDFSCTMGGCGACMAQLIEGTVELEQPNCLSSAERSAGKILTCIARPTSPCRVEKP